MRKRSSTVHHQFAEFFEDTEIKPLAYAVSRNLGNQSICLDPDKDLKGLLEEWEELSSGEMEKLQKYVRISGKYIGAQPEDQKPFIFSNGQLYLKRYFDYESSIIENVRRIKQLDQNEHTERIEQLGRSEVLNTLVRKKESDTNPDWQLIAAITAFLQNFTVITGGPGTGKTTTVARVLALLLESKPDLQVKLAAFTGKAGKRMEESLRDAATKLEISTDIKEKLSSFSALTLHRLLGYKKDSHHFWHNQGNPLAADVVIIDEASMVDVPLFAKVLEAIGENTRLILLGDQNQLASVEAGSVFGDICNSVNINHFDEEFIESINKFSSEELIWEEHVNPKSQILSNHIIALQKSWRSKDYPLITKFSKAILDADEYEINKFFQGAGKNEVIINQQDIADRLKEFASGFKSYIEEAKKGEEHLLNALRELNKQRVLSPVREGKQGIYHLNRLVEDYLEKENLLTPNTEFYENRPVMITKNNYELNVFNGDVGIIKYVDGTPHVFFLNNQGELKNHPASHIGEMETVFASTVHKSQGSEFDKIMVVLPKKFKEEIMTRELFYTAITRAKKQIILHATEEVVLKTVGNRIKRASGITQRINLQE